MKRILIFSLLASMALTGCALTETKMPEGPNAISVVSDPAREPVVMLPQRTVAGLQQQGMVAPQGVEIAPQRSVVKMTEVGKPELIKITGIGYGAEDTYAGYTTGQRRLLAIRSSKLDAYRSLAEQLYGIKIDSTTTVATLTAKNDSFRARVNALVRGARVVSVTPMADQNYETIMEVYVDKRFFEEAFVYRSGSLAASEAERVYKVSSYE
ncbi:MULTISPECIES: LPP20 family lipoprotein [Thiomicrorhabdus]|nr:MULTISPECIES: LPP20 family lipoprotein [Thiomicrorhabdus]